MVSPFSFVASKTMVMTSTDLVERSFHTTPSFIPGAGEGDLGIEITQQFWITLPSSSAS